MVKTQAQVMRNNTALLDITLQTQTQQQQIEREGHFEKA